MRNDKRVVGIEIGGSKLQAVAGTAAGRVDQTVRESANRDGGAVAIRQQVQQMVKSLLAEHPAEAIGIGFGGPVDGVTGRVIKSHHVDGWEDFSLATWVGETFGLPCRVSNDTDAAALAEAVVGAGRGKRRTFYTNIGSGIGAMEFGHTWSYSPMLGRWGRVEHLCSGWAIADRARAMLAERRIGLLPVLCDGDIDSIDAELVADAWQCLDPTAAQLMGDVIDAYSHALCSVVALLNPDIVVIGGGFALVGQPLFTALERAVADHVFEPFADNFTIVPAALGEQSVPVGALLLAAEA
jgi:glucokinase